MSGILFIISSPSGGGKGTLIRRLLQAVPNIGYSISFTTRQMREGETNGKDYFFVSAEEFENLVRNGEFLEYANVHGNFYGTSRRQVEKEIGEGRDVILEIDVQGAKSIHRLTPSAVRIFILPPSYQVLSERLTLRQTESRHDLSLRLLNAHSEVEHYKEFDYVVINDKIERATAELSAIVIAERLKCERQQRRVQEILKTFEKTE